MKYTNKHNISLPTALWLIYSEYDHIDLPNYISVTSLMKPVRQIILNQWHKVEEMDISSLLSSAIGSAIHSGAEKAWMYNKHTKNKLLKLLGYPPGVVDKVLINPTPEEKSAVEDPICIYLETRTIKEIEGFSLGGKFDIVIDGTLTDYKTTSVYKYMSEDSHEDYVLQGSLYRWLNPEIITSDVINIEFIFTDWKKSDSLKDPNYPKIKTASKTYKLMSLEETENWIVDKLRTLKKYRDTIQEKLPRCSDKELWRSKTLYKYFSNPSNTRASKVSENLQELIIYQQNQGKGNIVTVPGSVKRCSYCSVYDHCQQRLEYDINKS